MLVLTLTLHPAIDRIVRIERLSPGDTFDGKLLMSVPAGKGVNTARSLRRLGSRNFHVAAAAWVGQDDANWFQHRLASEGITAAIFPRECDTRFTATLLEASGRETHIKEAMQGVSPQEERLLLNQWERTVHRGDIVALCGSAPDRTTPETIRQLLATARGNGVKALLADTNGTALSVAAAAGIDGLKGNSLEIGGLLKLGGRFDPRNAKHRAALVALFKKDGAPRALLITMGSRGALLATAAETVIAAAPKLEASAFCSATGCGDAATAGWLWAIAEGVASEESLRRAIACGTAKAASIDPGGLDPKLVKRFLKRIKVERLR